MRTDRVVEDEDLGVRLQPTTAVRGTCHKPMDQAVGGGTHVVRAGHLCANERLHLRKIMVADLADALPVAAERERLLREHEAVLVEGGRLALLEELAAVQHLDWHEDLRRDLGGIERSEPGLLRDQAVPDETRPGQRVKWAKGYGGIHGGTEVRVSPPSAAGREVPPFSRLVTATSCEAGSVPEPKCFHALPRLVGVARVVGKVVAGVWVAVADRHVGAVYALVVVCHHAHLLRWRKFTADVGPSGHRGCALP